MVSAELHQQLIGFRPLYFETAIYDCKADGSEYMAYIVIILFFLFFSDCQHKACRLRKCEIIIIIIIIIITCYALVSINKHVKYRVRSTEQYFRITRLKGYDGMSAFEV